MVAVEEAQGSKPQKERSDPTSTTRANEKTKSISEITANTSFFVLNVSDTHYIQIATI